MNIIVDFEGDLVAMVVRVKTEGYVASVGGEEPIAVL